MKRLSSLSACRRPCGFTLVEMAMVLAIVTLLLVGLLPAISSQVEQQQLTETRKLMNDIEQALVGFAVINGRLPCPASSTSNGEESPVGGGACTNFNDGFVPAATLGLSTRNEQGLALDGWNNPIRYAVTSWDSTINDVYTTTNGMATVGLSSLSPNLLVCNTASTSSSSCSVADSALTSAPGVPVVIYSIGKNGGSGGSGTDEAENPNPDSADNDGIFVSHTPTSSSYANGEFDDIVVWISNPLLLNRLVSAGKLP